MGTTDLAAPPLFADMNADIREAWSGERIVRVSGWQLWPPRMSLDGKTALCRWCAKPLEGTGRRSYCSDACYRELWTRASLPELRRYVYERDNGICQECGINIGDLREAVYWVQRKMNEIQQRAPENWKLVRHWPSPNQILRVMGFKTVHLWEVNHTEAIAEGGDPVDVSKMKLTCEPCHRKHTAGVVKRRAKAKRVTKKFHNGVTA